MSNELLELYNRVSRIEQRLAGMVKHGRVAEVNPDEAWVRREHGEGDNGPQL